MIVCDKCSGKIFVDLTFVTNKDFETFCLRCGKRVFVGRSHPVYPLISAYVKDKLVR